MKKDDIKRKIAVQKNKVLSEEKELKKYFLSSYYVKSLCALLQSCTNKETSIEVMWADDFVAFTDGSKITININNKITNSFDTALYRDFSVKGLLGHELGHILFSDFDMLDKFQKTLKQGKVYGEQYFTHQNLDTLKNMLEDEESGARCIVYEIATNINNLLEDIYIEAKIKSLYPNSAFKKGIILNNNRLGATSDTFDKMLSSGEPKLFTIINYLIGYLKAQISSFGSYEGELIEVIKNCFPLLDKFSFQSSAEMREMGTMLLICELWDFVQEYIDSYIPPENKDNKNSSEDDISSTGRKKLTSEEIKKLKEQVDKDLKNKIKSIQTEIPKGKNAPVENSDNLSSESIKKDNEDEKIEFSDSKAIEAEGNGLTTYMTHHPKFEADDERFKLDVKKYSKEVVEEKENEKLVKNMKGICKQVISSLNKDLHKNVNFNIISISKPETYKKSYEIMCRKNNIYENAKHIAKVIERYFKDESFDDSRKNLFAGNKLMCRNLYRLDTDKRLFERTKKANESVDVSVTILVDMSGSMSGQRIKYARVAAAQLYEFCHFLKIPCSIFGHNTTAQNKVNIHKYIDADSYGDKEKFSIVTMEAKGGNRDGASIEYCCQYLMKRPEKKKLFFLISDGQPADYCYYGAEANKDCSDIANKYRKEGFIFIATAIGDDKKQIKEIYGSRNFLDITDLSQIAGKLQKIIKSQIIL